MNNRVARIALVAVEIFLGVTAIYGAIYVVPVQPRHYSPVRHLATTRFLRSGLAVIGFDVWLYATGLGPAVTFEKYGSLEGIPMPLGVPLPLWLQPFFLVFGLLILGLALRLWFVRAPHANTIRRSAVRQRQHATTGA